MTAPMIVAITTEIAAMIAHSRADAPRSGPAAWIRRTRWRSSSQRMLARKSIGRFSPRSGDRSGSPDSLCIPETSLSGQFGHGRVGKKHQEAEADDELGHQHRLGLLARLALDIGHLAAAQSGGARGERAADLRAVVGGERQRRGHVAQLV